ncbi:D-beta-hydroxybutyrate dehydrogenase, mitochondrial isoform X2 [Xenopus laevis]|uniref:D-beta-hydroxybutyrate dehydrogenase, mitochondrial isoform X2 n=1 Tax=Xenopus laevis TaxID=8355 RepID=A0A8J0VD09_XENLA|nr:D-beta-hydroxybutyrate dehydrogenase, mitochondrial isoform X2 [Xenopus laevis]
MGFRVTRARAVLLVLLSLGLTLALGLGLPEALKLLFRFLGFPSDSVSHGIVLLYLVFMLWVAMPTVPRGTLPVEGKEVLITGCDTGFGFALAKHLHKLGFTVFAGCLLKPFVYFQDKNGNGAEELQGMQSDRMHVFQLNVCNEEEVGKALEFVKQRLENTEKGLWGVVNNAGISTFGDVEFTTLDKYKEVMDVNLWGTVRITKAFLPLIRRAKGRVVCVGSTLGRMCKPSRSCYSISKIGIEAFTGCLRQEMYQWGVKVINIEAGNFIAATELFTKEGVERRGEEMWEEASDILRADYGKTPLVQQVTRMKSIVGCGAKEKTDVLNAITDALRSKYPYTRYILTDTYSWIEFQIMSLLPTAIADWIYIS